MRCKRNRFREGEMTIPRARQMAGQQGCGFEANSPAELKQGLALMKRQLQDMEAHRHQYELALQNGFVIAGFGGNLDGIEVPETLMTGEVPAGMTPSQAFDEVLDYMRNVIDNLSTKLSDSSAKSSALPRRATKYLESKKDLRESEDSYLCTFFNFDDMVDEYGELKQIDEVTESLQELIDCNYLDNMWGVWFEDYDGLAEAAGLEVKTMPDILAADPEAEFGYSYGSPDTRLSLENAEDYVRDVGCDDWEHYGIKPTDDEDSEDDSIEETVNTQKKSFKEFVPRGMNELLSQLEEAKKQGIIVDYDMVDPLEAYVFISNPDYATINAVEEIFDTFDKFEVTEDPSWPAPNGCKTFSIARL